MTLNELIRFLESKDPEIIPVIGFKCPHSYRGYYERIAFVPIVDDPPSVGVMLATARMAIGSTYTGWKGGEYEMDGHTDVYLARTGECGTRLDYHLLECCLGGNSE